MPPDTPAALLAAALADDAARPLLTHYDDATGERVELSVATTANWVAKAGNLLQDGAGTEPGERVGLLLPLHWQTAVLLLACWSVGAVAQPGAASGADVVFAAADRLDEAIAAGAREVYALSLRPLGAPLPETPAGVVDFAREVLGYPDTFAPYAPVDPAGEALRLGGRVLEAAEVARAAVEGARGHGVHRGDRVLTTLPYDTEAGLDAGLLVPLAAGAGVVLCRHLDPAALPGRVGQERVTATAGVDVPGLPRLV